jgi:hypothetical protein
MAMMLTIVVSSSVVFAVPGNGRGGAEAEVAETFPTKTMVTTSLRAEVG